MSFKNAAEVFDDLCARFIINNPHEEFSSFERVLFQIEQAHWFYEDFYRRKYGLPKYTLERFVELMFHHCPNLKPFASGVKTIYRDFKSYKSSVPVCGGILINPDLTKVVLVQGYGSKTWGFPRGKINKDEDPGACALREVLEETGYDASANLLLDEYIDFTNRKQAVRLYLCPNVPENTQFETRTRNEIKKITWFRIEQLPMSFESKNQPGIKLFNVSPVLVSQLRSWIKKRKKKSGKPSKKKGQADKQTHRHMKDRTVSAPVLSDPNFPTDSEISGRSLVERDLVRWEPSDEDVDSTEYTLSDRPVGSWNQWEENSKKFGFVSTYNYDDYTVKADPNNAVYADSLLKSLGYKVRPKKDDDSDIFAVATDVANKQQEKRAEKKKVGGKSKGGGGGGGSSVVSAAPPVQELSSSPASQFRLDAQSVLGVFD